jgi:hypothetical protein
VSRRIEDGDEVQLPGRGSEMIVTLADIKNVIKTEGLSPDELYGKEFMKNWRHDEDEIERIYGRVDRDMKAEKGQAAWTPPPPAEAVVEKKPEPAEKPLDPMLDPKTNPFIKLD